MKTIKQFEKKKKYVFDKNIATKHDPEIEEVLWADECDGKEVKRINDFKGEIGLYDIIPEWTKEVKNK